MTGSKTKSTRSGEWVSALEAVAMLGGRTIWFSDSPQARQILLYAREGVLKSRAAMLVKRSSNGDTHEENVELVPDFWEGVFAENDVEAWRQNSFARLEADGVSMRATGVEFSTAGLATIGGSIGEPAQEAAGQGGRKPALDRWQSFYFAVIELAQQDRLNEAAFPTQAELSEEIQLMMGEGAFAPDHVKRVVAQIYKRFVRAKY